MKKERKTSSNRRKIFAAVCMLLVASMLVVTASYAWFTLSTAPEVKGISTAVGANGNLEIALLPKDGDLMSIGTRAGDSLENMEIRNLTWGNLIDLSNNEIYGLDAITLYPSELNAIFDNEGNLVSFGKLALRTPAYTEDGRIDSTIANTVTASYDAVKQNFMPDSESEVYGVRAVGTASGMTDRQLVYRNSRSTAATAAASAKNVAAQSLNANGSTLASVAVKKGTGQTVFARADLEAMQTIVNDLLGEGDKTGALGYVERAYMHYILAYAASGAVKDLDKVEDLQAYKAVQVLISAEDATLDSVLSQLSGITLPAAFTSAMDSLKATKASVVSADAKLNALLATEATEFQWADIRDVVMMLVDVDNMELNGIKVGEIMDNDNMNLLFAGMSQGFLLTMGSNGGVYADIADHCGDFTVDAKIEGIKYNGLVLGALNTRIETKTAVVPAYLDAINLAVESAKAPASGAITDQPLTDMFGYIIDLALRTNAAESNLLLQVEGADRIYSDNENPGTMGAGSSMIFSTITSDLDEEQIRDLLGAIRLVFFVPGEQDNTVLATAKLDAAAAAYEDGEGWKAYLQMIKTTQVDGQIVETDLEDMTIMPLEKNKATQLSVLVYLDGSSVENEDVAASAATSMVGKLNLQFASSATLIPMDYAPLHTPAN